MAAMSSEYVQWIQPQEEVDENVVVHVDHAVAFDGHYNPSTQRELESRVVANERYTTYARPQLMRPKGLAMADSHSRVSHVEAWINWELFGDVVEAHQDEGELYITTLREDVDEYLEMVDFMRSTAGSLAGSYGIGEERCHVLPEGIDDLFSSPVDLDYRGMYYDEPQLWCFS